MTIQCQERAWLVANRLPVQGQQHSVLSLGTKS
jgi:hypothetical protein